MPKFTFFNRDYEWCAIRVNWQTGGGGGYESNTTLHQNDRPVEVDTGEYIPLFAWQPKNERITDADLEKYGVTDPADYADSHFRVVFGKPEGEVPDDA